MTVEGMHAQRANAPRGARVLPQHVLSRLDKSTRSWYVPVLTLPSFLHFEPVPVRARHDGWTPDLQRRFILLLGCGAGPAAAARRLGRSRQTVYALRARRGAESFSAAWDAAEAFAREAGIVGRTLPRFEHGLETLLVPRFYRGRLVGFVQREDHQAAMRTLARLDRIAASEAFSLSTVGFDELVDLACAGLEADKTDAMRQ